MYKNLAGTVMLVLMSLFVVILFMLAHTEEPVEPNDLMMDYAYDPEATVDTSGVTIDFTPWDSGILLTLTADGKMELGSPPIAIVDLETGRVFLYGDPDEAARIFWEAVELMRR